MIANHLTQSAFNYVGAIYEEAIDAGMHLGDVQHHLSRNGIHKSLLAIKIELNDLYCFHRYAETHPAPPTQTYEQIDTQLARRHDVKA
ncbi:hypothetical protein ACFOHT_19425 [Massilia oculi]|uniref:hypothetical protein n=1 Tax=Massilia oculi TaxID=945844 RepID=UPI0013B468AE|nr:hypothetical protein [Massilia oculi]